MSNVAILEERIRRLTHALERVSKLTPAAANAHTARDLYLTASTIAVCALDADKEMQDPKATLDDLRDPVTEEMCMAGYNAARDQNGMPPQGLVLGHVSDIYNAMVAYAATANGGPDYKAMWMREVETASNLRRQLSQGNAQ